MKDPDSPTFIFKHLWNTDELAAFLVVYRDPNILLVFSKEYMIKTTTDNTQHKNSHRNNKITGEEAVLVSAGQRLHEFSSEVEVL